MKISEVHVIESSRFSADLRTRCMAFVDILCDYQQKIYFHQDIVVNVDETRIDISRRKPITKSVISTNQTKAFLSRIKKPELRSMLIFCNAAGDVLLNVLITPTSNTKKDEKWQNFPINSKDRRNGRILNRAYAWNIKGWVTKKIWWESVKLFVGIIHRIFPGRQVVLVLDKLAMHLNWEIVNYFYRNGVYCFFLPKKSSHVLQPLDQYMFANFKNLLRKRIDESLQTHNSTSKMPLNNNNS